MSETNTISMVKTPKTYKYIGFIELSPIRPVSKLLQFAFTTAVSPPCDCKPGLPDGLFSNQNSLFG
jgi:hypothetical protein